MGLRFVVIFSVNGKEPLVRTRLRDIRHCELFDTTPVLKRKPSWPTVQTSTRKRLQHTFSCRMISSADSERVCASAGSVTTASQAAGFIVNVRIRLRSDVAARCSTSATLLDSASLLHPNQERESSFFTAHQHIIGYSVPSSQPGNSLTAARF